MPPHGQAKIVNVGYRCARAPVSVADRGSYAALECLAAHGAELNDPGRLAVGDDSAGYPGDGHPADGT